MLPSLVTATPLRNQSGWHDNCLINLANRPRGAGHRPRVIRLAWISTARNSANIRLAKRFIRLRNCAQIIIPIGAPIGLFGRYHLPVIKQCAELAIFRSPACKSLQRANFLMIAECVANFRLTPTYGR